MEVRHEERKAIQSRVGVNDGSAGVGKELSSLNESSLSTSFIIIMHSRGRAVTSTKPKDGGGVVAIKIHLETHYSTVEVGLVQ